MSTLITIKFNLDSTDARSKIINALIDLLTQLKSDVRYSVDISRAEEVSDRV